MKKAGVIITSTLAILFCLGLFLLKTLNSPNLTTIKSRNNHLSSEISYRKNYIDLVKQDQKLNLNFLITEAKTAIVYSNKFPFEKEELDKTKTNDLLMILNDSANYTWFEWGTPEYTKTIVYLDSDKKEIGYTQWEPNGEADSYPYRSLMKWGGLTTNGTEKIKKIID